MVRLAKQVGLRVDPPVGKTTVILDFHLHAHSLARFCAEIGTNHLRWTNALMGGLNMTQ